MTTELDTTAAQAATDLPAAAASAAGDATVDDASRDTGDSNEHNDAGDAAQVERDKTLRKLQRRIDNRTKAIGQRDQEIAQLRQELAQRQANSHQDEDDEGAQHPQRGDDVETRAAQLARETLYRGKIADKTSSMLKAGAALDPDFRAIALDVSEEIPFIDRNGRPTPFIEAVLDADAPAELLLHLGKNPDVVADLADLTPTQLARRLAKLEIEIAKQPPKRSAAAKPLAAVSGGGLNSRDESAMSDAEWREQRRKRA